MKDELDAVYAEVEVVSSLPAKIARAAPASEEAKPVPAIREVADEKVKNHDTLLILAWQADMICRTNTMRDRLEGGTSRKLADAFRRCAAEVKDTIDQALARVDHIMKTSEE
jgi:hypothetical protein